MKLLIIKAGNFQQKNISSASASASGDLMADLHKKLALRRKGISGTNQNDSKTVSETSPVNSKGFNLIESISLMIPVPLNSAKQTNESNDESDWD